jgi:flagellar motor switch protein FliN/FliY
MNARTDIDTFNPEPTAVDYADIGPSQPTGPGLLNGQLDVVKNVKVRLHIRAGSAEVSVGDLLALREGQVVTLEQALDAPLEVMLDDQIVATCELMAVGDRFAVRIVDGVRRS